LCREEGQLRVVPKISQETPAEMVGTTRSRVNFFMNKFRKLGFIHYNGGLQVHNSLLLKKEQEKRAEPGCLHLLPTKLTTRSIPFSICSI
jgi:hypothetical protein